MITFPNAKINLGLHVLNKRTDGYHEIETCLYPVELCDALEIIKSESFSFQSTGLEIAGDVDSNLVIKAYNLIKSDYAIPPVSIHLHKVIPMGTGLGGGSSDGAFALKMFDELFDLKLDGDQLRKYASQLGSDCSFFIDNTLALASGTGTILQPIDEHLDDYRIELRHVDVHMSTKEAYSLVRPTEGRKSILDILQVPLYLWQLELVNDFESPVLARFPAIQKAKNELIQEGALYAAMTGSGSSVFGIFKK